jgi:hypothetical protein
MEPEGLILLWRMGSEARGGQAAISISWDGGGVVWANFFNALVGIGWRKKKIGGALRDWDFDEGFLMLWW